MLAVARADAGAFDLLYERYSARLFSFLVRLCKQQHVAEDLFQEAWCRFARHAKHLSPDTDPFRWLLTVGRNAYYDQARRQRRLLVDADQVDRVGHDATSERAVETREEMVRLEHALARLSDLDREVLLLLFSEELTPRQAARVLGIGDTALRKRLSRARERLGQHLSQMGHLNPRRLA